MFGPGVTLITSSFCPTCKTVKDIFNGGRIPFNEVNVENIPNGAQMVFQLTGKKAVPQIFVDGQYFGDTNALVAAMRDGTFLKLMGR